MFRGIELCAFANMEYGGSLLWMSMKINFFCCDLGFGTVFQGYSTTHFHPFLSFGGGYWVVT